MYTRWPQKLASRLFVLALAAGLLASMGCSHARKSRKHQKEMKELQGQLIEKHPGCCSGALKVKEERTFLQRTVTVETHYSKVPISTTVASFAPLAEVCIVTAGFPLLCITAPLGLALGSLIGALMAATGPLAALPMALGCMIGAGWPFALGQVTYEGLEANERARAIEDLEAQIAGLKARRQTTAAQGPTSKAMAW